MNTPPKTDCSPKIEAETYRFSPGADTWILPSTFLLHLEGMKRLGLEIIFEPLWAGPEEPAESAEGTTTLQTNDGVLLGIRGTFQNCMDLVKAFGFEPYTDDPYAFHYPHPKTEIDDGPETYSPRKMGSAPIVINLTSFQGFDHGQEISQHVSTDLEPRVGNKIPWECGCNLSGILEVLSVGQRDGDFVECTLKKLS